MAIDRLQSTLGPFIDPPDLKLSLGALSRPPSGILRQQQHVDEAADGKPDVNEDADRARPRYPDHPSENTLPEVQSTTYLLPLHHVHHQDTLPDADLLRDNLQQSVRGAAGVLTVEPLEHGAQVVQQRPQRRDVSNVLERVRRHFRNAVILRAGPQRFWLMRAWLATGANGSFAAPAT